MTLTELNPPEPTFDRLLQVAVEVFAEVGFRDATVRGICAKANVNVASVSYYFRNKETLYEQAIQFAFQEACRLYPPDASFDQSLSPELRLGFFVESFLRKLLDDSHLGFLNKLVAREIYEPTKALDNIITCAIAPQFAHLEAIIQQILGEAVNKLTVQRCITSIMGQCLMFKYSRSIIDRLYPELIADAKEMQATAQHITQFSLAALTHVKDIIHA